MTKILLRKQLAEIFRTYLYDAKKNKARSRGTVITYFVLFALLMVVVLGGMFTFVAFMLRSTVAAGYGWFYYLIFALAASQTALDDQASQSFRSRQHFRVH